jgi:hypothetical protein
MAYGKITAVVMVATGALLSGCADNTSKALACQVLQGLPGPSEAAKANANCPASTDVYLSAVFDEGRPVGVGGGQDASGDTNDKVVRGNQKICWVATDKSGGSSDMKFDILFSPADSPSTNSNYQSINIFPHPPSGIEYKYTVWAGEGECMFFDPKFVIN